MDATGTTSHSPFDKLFTRNVPHIIEKIFLSLDYYSFKSCLKVNKKWNQVLTSESFQKMGKSSFNVWLISAAKFGHGDMAQLLLRLGAEADNKSENNIHTPLYYAAHKGHMGVVKVLLDGGANPNVETRNGWTPLHSAVMEGHKDVAKLLLEAGADPTKEAKDGSTPVYVAYLFSKKDFGWGKIFGH